MRHAATISGYPPLRETVVGLELHLHWNSNLVELKLRRTLSTDRVTQVVLTGTVADICTLIYLYIGILAY